MKHHVQFWYIVNIQLSVVIDIDQLKKMTLFNTEAENQQSTEDITKIAEGQSELVQAW